MQETRKQHNEVGMDQQQTQPPMNGNDELAKALDGGLQFEETPMSGATNTTPGATPTDATSDTPMPDPTSLPDPGLLPPLPPLPGTGDDAAKTEEPADTKTSDEPPTVHHTHATKTHEPTGDSDLDKIKASALDELRPLVGKLDLPAEEKFDTLLLIIRSTDDQSLLDEAHQAAKSITDETRRAQALLDIVKEIDYFSNNKK